MSGNTVEAQYLAQAVGELQQIKVNTGSGGSGTGTVVTQSNAENLNCTVFQQDGTKLKTQAFQSDASLLLCTVTPATSSTFTVSPATASNFSVVPATAETIFPVANVAADYSDLATKRPLTALDAPAVGEQDATCTLITRSHVTTLPFNPDPNINDPIEQNQVPLTSVQCLIPNPGKPPNLINAADVTVGGAVFDADTSTWKVKRLRVEDESESDFATLRVLAGQTDSSKLLATTFSTVENLGYKIGENNERVAKKARMMVGQTNGVENDYGDLAVRNLPLETLTAVLEARVSEFKNAVYPFNLSSQSVALNTTGGAALHFGSDPIPTKDDSGRDGWLYIREGGSGAGKMFNVYFWSGLNNPPNSGTETKTLSNVVSAYAVVTNDYVQKSTGIARIGFLQSTGSKFFQCDLSKVGKGEKVLVYYGSPPNLYINIRHIALTVEGVFGTFVETNPITLAGVFAGDTADNNLYVRVLLESAGILFDAVDDVYREIKFIGSSADLIQVQGSVTVGNFPASQAVTATQATAASLRAEVDINSTNNAVLVQGVSNSTKTNLACNSSGHLLVDIQDASLVVTADKVGIAGYEATNSTTPTRNILVDADGQMLTSAKISAAASGISVYAHSKAAPNQHEKLYSKDNQLLVAQDNGANLQSTICAYDGLNTFRISGDIITKSLYTQTAYDTSSVAIYGQQNGTTTPKPIATDGSGFLYTLACGTDDTGATRVLKTTSTGEIKTQENSITPSGWFDSTVTSSVELMTSDTLLGGIVYLMDFHNRASDTRYFRVYDSNLQPNPVTFEANFYYAVMAPNSSKTISISQGYRFSNRLWILGTTTSGKVGAPSIVSGDGMQITLLFKQ